MITATRLSAATCLVLISATTAWAQTPVRLTGNQPAQPSELPPLLQRPAQLDIEAVTLETAFLKLTDASGVALAFSPPRLPTQLRVSCRCQALTVRDALDHLLKGTSLVYMEVAGQIVLYPPVRRELDGSLPALAIADMGRVAGGVIERIHDPVARPVLPQEAFVSGIVVNASTEQPLEGAQVEVEGTGQGTLTDGRGRFRIQGVRGTEVTLRVVMLGYRSATQVVRVGTPDLRIALNETAIELDELVVTGTAGPTRKRALGNSLVRLDAAELQRTAPVADIKGLLNGRAPGVIIQPAGGQAGASTRIRIRGTGSLFLSTEPLIYVDGVRVDNANDRGFLWRAISRLNDIDPNTIESIEIIKGPAAATLYGTEASNGVIQIITKKGTPGAPRVTFNMAQGADWIPNPEERFRTGYQRLPDGTVQELNLVREESERGTPSPTFRTAHTQRYSVEVNGGSETSQYYLTGGYNDEKGVVDPNRLQRFTGRANLSTALSTRLTVSANVGYVSSRNENADYRLLYGAFRPSPALANTPSRGYPGGPPEALRAAYTEFEDLSRFSGGIQAEYRPARWLTNRLTVGIDDFVEEANTVVPRLPQEIGRFFGQDALGLKFIDRRDLTMTTVDYGGTANLNLTQAIGSSTSFGVQYYRKFLKSSQLTGRGFPAPGISTISSAADRTAAETFVENITFGVYAQQQFSWHDRLFLTAALRADDNSAFGREFNLVTYPKVSGAWVLSEEPFWSVPLVSTLRLRAAYGESGLQPDAFAALTTFQPVPGPGGIAAVRPQFPGNPNLGPERGQEIELGFEAGLFQDRLGIDFTYYDKTTKDAIVERSTDPSGGFPAAQFVNLGEVKNRGFELQVKGTPLARRRTRLGVSLSLSRNDNEITDMGDLPELSLFFNQQHRRGFPVAAYFGKVVVSADVDASGTVTNIMCDAGVNGRQGGQPIPCAQARQLYVGQPLPKWEGAVTGNLTLFDRLTLSGLIDFKLGHRVFHIDIYGHCFFLRACRENVFPQENPVAAGEMATGAPQGPFVTPEVSFTKLRELSASYRLPDAWAQRFGWSTADLTVAARNIYTWSDFMGPDPENSGILVRSIYPVYQAQNSQFPHPLQFLTSIRLTL